MCFFWFMIVCEVKFRQSRDNKEQGDVDGGNWDVVIIVVSILGHPMYFYSLSMAAH